MEQKRKLISRLRKKEKKKSTPKEENRQHEMSKPTKTMHAEIISFLHTMDRPVKDT